MANVATALSAVPVSGRSTVSYQKLTPVVVTFDTTGADLTIYTPATTRYAAIVGLAYQESSAHTLTIKSASTTLVTLEASASGGIVRVGIAEGPVVIGKLGEALVLNCGTAAISTMLVYVAEFSELILR